jgi:hypothetical protein
VYTAICPRGSVDTSLGLRPDFSQLVVDASLVACPDLPRKSSSCLGFGCWFNVVLGVFCESVSV